MPPPQLIRVTVCACTYRRPHGLAALLKGLGEQTFECLQRPLLRVIIADNEGSDQARRQCDQFRLSSDIPIEYVHEPRRGISYARNACLDRIRDDSDFFAMIDDDEIPDTGWIEQLLVAQQRTGADVVEGRVVPVFPEGAPDWIVQGRYFGWHHGLNGAHRPGQKAHPQLDEARTNNVLVKCGLLRTLGVRFDPRFGLSGGGDIIFFRAIHAAGYRIVFAPDACVKETIPLERTSLRYLWWLWYRVGSNERFKRPKRTKPNGSLKHIVRSKWRSSGCSSFCNGLATLTGALLRGRTDMRYLGPGLKSVSYGLGQVSSAIGVRYEQYRDDDMRGDTSGQPLRIKSP